MLREGILPPTDRVVPPSHPPSGISCPRRCSGGPSPRARLAQPGAPPCSANAGAAHRQQSRAVRPSPRALPADLGPRTPDRRGSPSERSLFWSAVTVLERRGPSSPPGRRSKRRRGSGGGARAPEGVRAPAAGRPRATKGAPAPPGTPPPSPMSSAIERKSLDPSDWLAASASRYPAVLRFHKCVQKPEGASGRGAADPPVPADMRRLPAEHRGPLLPEGHRPVLARGLPELRPVRVPAGRGGAAPLLQAGPEAVPPRLPQAFWPRWSLCIL
ncbi:rhombotin-2 isoform X2 [Equus przewalskii]|uniref:Rhombotin-2 isoform X2 n=1 Tax=Equus przewalskii TaxID=9798 RepID=A0ABM4JVA3_EQUPR